MRYEPMPEFETEEEVDAWYMNENVKLMDHQPWEVIESVDDLLEAHGLEIVYFGEDPEPWFTIRKRNEPAN